MKVIFFDSDSRLREFFKDFDKADVVFIDTTAQDTMEDVIAQHFDAGVISVFTSSYLSADFMAKFKNLKLIAARSTGINNIDSEYCKVNNIEISNVTGYGEIAVSEFAVGLLLALSRKIFLASGDLKTGRVDMSKYEGFDISGKTVGVFGTGAIGSHFAKIIHSFGAKIIAHDRNENPELANILTYVDLDTLYAKSDIVALNIPANAANYHIVDSVALEKMKRGAVVLNIARGELIDSGALYEAILSGHIGGVAMDVLEQEGAVASVSGAQGLTPEQMKTVLFNEKMLNMDNVIFTPHVAFNSAEANLRILAKTRETLEKA